MEEVCEEEKEQGSSKQGSLRCGKGTKEVPLGMQSGPEGRYGPGFVCKGVQGASMSEGIGGLKRREFNGFGASGKVGVAEEVRRR